MSLLISAKQLSLDLLKENIIILDCRYNLAEPDQGYEAYKTMHIPGAIYLHPDHDLSSPIIAGITGRHPLPTTNQLEQLIKKIGLNSDSQVVCYDNAGGAIAVRAWWILKYIGFDQVSLLDGGWPAWQKHNFKTDAGLPDTNSVPGNFKLNIQSDIAISANELTAMSDQYTVLDARAHERYLGKNETIDPIAGHIPGALSAPFSENLDSEGYFKSPEQIRSRFDELASDRTFVHYCGSGITACHNLFAMELAGLNPGKLYPGSWSEWIVDSKRPIA